MAPTDVFRYGEYVFGYEPAAHHREMVEFCLEGIGKRINSVDLEPRGAAKTTWVTTILLSWLIAKNPDLRVGLFSKTAERAFDMSRGIRLTLERNERFKEVFGHLVSDTKWTDAAWLRAGSRWEGSKDVTLFAGGVGGQVVSKRFDILLLDDVIDDENSATTDQRERINQWMWKTAYPCLSADGVVLDIGTRWAEDDIHQVLIDPKPKGKGWRHRVEGALTLDGGEYRSYWPEVWPVDKLLSYKENMGGPMFACAYLNDISAMMEGNVFQKTWLQWFDTDPALADRHGYLLMPDGDYTHRMGVDLAMSTRERADFTARVTLAENRRGDFFVLAAQRDKMEGGHAAFVNSGYQAFPQISAVKVESVQAQSLLVQELMRDYPRIPVVPKKTDTDKMTRARAVAARFEAHKVWLHSSLQGSDFVDELMKFPMGHDDFVDALGFAMDLGGSDFSFSVVKPSDLNIARGPKPVDPEKAREALKTAESDMLKRAMQRTISGHFGQMR